MDNTKSNKPENKKSVKFRNTIIVASCLVASISLLHFASKASNEKSSNLSFKQLLRHDLNYPNYIIIKKDNAKPLELKC